MDDFEVSGKAIEGLIFMGRSTSLLSIPSAAGDAAATEDVDTGNPPLTLPTGKLVLNRDLSNSCQLTVEAILALCPGRDGSDPANAMDAARVTPRDGVAPLMGMGVPPVEAPPVGVDLDATINNSTSVIRKVSHDGVATSSADTVAPSAVITAEHGANICSDKGDDATICSYTLKLPITSVVSLPMVNSSDCCVSDQPSATTASVAPISASLQPSSAMSDATREVQTHAFPMIIGTSSLPPL
jgi:hypothetical protein